MSEDKHCVKCRILVKQHIVLILDGITRLPVCYGCNDELTKLIETWLKEPAK